MDKTAQQFALEQLDKMVGFIDKEAREKAAEITQSTFEEFNAEKGKLFIQQREKITLEFKRKMEQEITNKKMFVLPFDTRRLTPSVLTHARSPSPVLRF